MVYLALDGTGFCPERSSKTLDAMMIIVNTLGKFISWLSNADMKHQLLNFDFPHRVLFLSLRLFGNFLWHDTKYMDNIIVIN